MFKHAAPVIAASPPIAQRPVQGFEEEDCCPVCGHLKVTAACAGRLPVTSSQGDARAGVEQFPKTIWMDCGDIESDAAKLAVQHEHNREHMQCLQQLHQTHDDLGAEELIEQYQLLVQDRAVEFVERMQRWQRRVSHWREDVSRDLHLRSGSSRPVVESMQQQLLHQQLPQHPRMTQQPLQRASVEEGPLQQPLPKHSTFAVGAAQIHNV
eukprot:TRINITY_DN32999_c0_g1_i1.p1 TRINITY_DN32999_c0_g1~~TRINITY_DN32999_c0_g1_i1.p1  ORF type:complete len:210 (+),score=50.18 TRINITY_DN32999_c0_g1_i1:42-671(+)